MTQIQLSDAQAVILSTACAREDGAVFPVTASLKGGAVGNVCKSLLKQGLIEEIAATDLNTVWRHDEESGGMTRTAARSRCAPPRWPTAPSGSRTSRTTRCRLRRQPPRSSAGRAPSRRP